MANKKSKQNAANTSATANIGDKMNFAATEAYKLLRTNLMFSFTDTDCKVIGMTSSVKGEGKSTTSINLAYTLGVQGYKVLLIDGDLRIPGLSPLLKIRTDMGLSSLLSGLTNKVTDVLHCGIFDNVDFIPCGEIVPNPAELLGSARMKATLDGLKNLYDYIIIDLAPVTAVSDPLVVSKYLKGMILVVRHEYADQKEVAEAIRLLKFSQVRILGFVYNGYSGNSGAYSKKYYKKNYGYGEKNQSAAKTTRATAGTAHASAGAKTRPAAKAHTTARAHAAAKPHTAPKASTAKKTVAAQGTEAN